MTTYPTPGPVALTVRFAAGQLAVTAEDTDTATIDVRPGNPHSDADIEHAAATVVEQRGDQIVVVAPDTKGWFARTPRLHIQATIPTRSDATVSAKSADVELVGEFGRTAVTSASGDVRVDRASELTLKAASSDVSIGSVAGDTAVRTASGDIRVDSVGGSAELGTASGDITVADTAHDVRVRTASGDVDLGVVGGSIQAGSASGDIQVASVRQGSVEIDTHSGDVTIGVAEGTAAWLDVQTHSGDLTSTLDHTESPGDETATVSIHAQSRSGDITIRRASR